MQIQSGYFYFLNDAFFQRFPEGTMPNKEDDALGRHHRPYYFALELNGVMWMIPVSSKTNKYEKIHQHKIEKYGHCDTIYFANIMNKKRVFLIQNMVPVTIEYINEQYKTKDVPVSIKIIDQNELKKIVNRVIGRMKSSRFCLFTDIRYMLKELNLPSI